MMKKQLIRCGFLMLASTLSLAACEVGPDYQRPGDGAVPSRWLSNTPDKMDSNAVIEQDWWKIFKDPVLAKLIDQASAGNFDLKIATARIAQARASTRQARADLFPTINAHATPTREANRIAFPGEGGSSALPIDLTKPFDTYETGFDASWELDLFGGTRRQIEESNANFQAAQATADDVRISLLAEVARNYIDIRHDQAQLAIIDQTVASDKKTLALTQEMYKAGTIAHTDVTRADAERQQAESDLSTYENEVAQAEFSLDVLLGAQPGTAAALIGGHGPIPSARPALIMGTPAMVIANRPDIRAAERQLAAATAHQGVATAQLFPKISLSGFLGLLNVSAADLLRATSRSWMESATLMTPVFDFGKLRAGVDLANAQQQEALASYEKSVVGALSDVESALTAYKNAQLHRASLAQVVADDRRTVGAAQERYKQGSVTFLDVLDANRSLYAAQSDLSAADAQVSESLVAVYKALGGGWKDPEGAAAR